MQQKHSTEQDRSWWQQLHGNLLYLYFRVSFISVMSVQKKKKENWPQIFIIHFSEKKLKFDTDFRFFIFLCSEKNKNRTFFFHFSTFKKIKIEHRFSLFALLSLEKNENWKSVVNFYFSFFKLTKKWKLNTDFLFSFFNLQKKWMTLIYTHFKKSFCTWFFF